MFSVKSMRCTKELAKVPCKYGKSRPVQKSAKTIFFTSRNEGLHSPVSLQLQSSNDKACCAVISVNSMSSYLRDPVDGLGSLDAEVGSRVPRCSHVHYTFF
jgi:hypothetical protein